MKRTSSRTRRTGPADSAMKMPFDGEAGSATAANILDFIDSGLPCLLADLRALRSRWACAALGRIISGQSSKTREWLTQRRRNGQDQSIP